MNKIKFLKAAQEHGNARFNQGYAAAKQEIAKHEWCRLASMPEAVHCILAYQKIFDALKPHTPIEVLSWFK